MIQFSFTPTDKDGIHARPAGLLVKEAQKYTSNVTMTKGSKSASVKKLFALMGLAVKQNETVTVSIEGEDELTAAPVIEQFLKDNF